MGKSKFIYPPQTFWKDTEYEHARELFSIDTDLELFEGLYISERKDLCEEYMGKFPVLSVSLKNIDAADYETARAMTVKIINLEARRLQFLMQSKKLTAFDKEEFTRLLQRQMDDDTLFYSLQELTELLNKHYGKSNSSDR